MGNPEMPLVFNPDWALFQESNPNKMEESIIVRI